VVVDSVVFRSPAGGTAFDPSAPNCTETPTVTYTAAPGAQLDPSDIVFSSATSPFVGSPILYLTATAPGIDLGTASGANANWVLRDTQMGTTDASPIDMGTHHAVIDSFTAQAVGANLTFSWTLSPEAPTVESGAASCTISPAVGALPAALTSVQSGSITGVYNLAQTYTLTCTLLSGSQALTVSPPF